MARTNRDILLGIEADVKTLVARSCVPSPQPPAPSPTPTPLPPPSNPYAQFVGWTPQEVLAHYTGGLPTWWNWEAAYAAGVLRGAAPQPSPTPTPPPPVQVPGEIPWNGSAGQGDYLPMQGGVVTAPINVPAGFSGKRQFMVTKMPVAPGESQFDTVAVEILGTVYPPSMDSNMGTTPQMVGPQQVMVKVTMTPPGRCSFQLIGQ